MDELFDVFEGDAQSTKRRRKDVTEDEGEVVEPVTKKSRVPDIRYVVPFFVWKQCFVYFRYDYFFHV